MTAVGTTNRRRFLCTALAEGHERRLAFAIGVAALFAFIAIAPFARTPLAMAPAFIPSYGAALVLVDLLTAVLLLEQFVRLRSIAVLVLAAGYFFDALIIIPHALTFPGAFSAIGLLGAQSQTTAWLYVFWHGGFPLFVMGYAVLRAREGSSRPPILTKNVRRTAITAAAAVVVLVLALTMLATAGHDLLPALIQGSDFAPLERKVLSPAVWLLTLIAIIMLWQKRQRLIDLWLMLVMWIWLLDIGLSAVIGAARFDLGWYSGRVFGLLAASFLLVTLVLELGQMYARAVGAVTTAEDRIVELMRARARPDLQQTGKGTDAFVVNQNIAHYRSLLETGGFDFEQRDAIHKLLAEEQAKLRPPG